MGSKRFHMYLDIPESQLGDWSIVHRHYPAGHTMTTANARCAFIGGQRSKTLKFESPTRWHELREGDGLWMTDLPIEQAQHDRILRHCDGKVLVGGLGLGYAATLLARKRKVTEVVVVEKSWEVIDLVEPFLNVPGGKLRVVCEDLFEYLKHTESAFDWAFYDIWASDSERTFFETLVPLIEHSFPTVPAGRILAWNEDVMRGQLQMNLYGVHHSEIFRKLHPDKDSPFNATWDFFAEDHTDEPGALYLTWRRPFAQWVIEAKPSNEQIERAIHYYSAVWGNPGWQDAWNRYTNSVG